MKPYWQSSTRGISQIWRQGQSGKYKILRILLCFGDLLGLGFRVYCLNMLISEERNRRKLKSGDFSAFFSPKSFV
jgi:hypothetical protein